MENNRISELTCTDRIRLCANIGVTRLTNTFDSIRLRIMCTSGIQSTVTIVHVTLIYPHINVTEEEERTISPAQTGLHVQPTLTNPVLQLHLTAWLFESWEQTAFLSHPPFFTKQLSGEERENGWRDTPCWPFPPVQMILEEDPVLVKPVLHAHFTAWVVRSWEQVAFGSHPPLFTRQLSRHISSNSVFHSE